MKEFSTKLQLNSRAGVKDVGFDLRKKECQYAKWVADEIAKGTPLLAAYSKVAKRAAKHVSKASKGKGESIAPVEIDVRAVRRAWKRYEADALAYLKFRKIWVRTPAWGGSKGPVGAESARDVDFGSASDLSGYFGSDFL